MICFSFQRQANFESSENVKDLMSAKREVVL